MRCLPSLGSRLELRNLRKVTVLVPEQSLSLQRPVLRESLSTLCANGSTLPVEVLIMPCESAEAAAALSPELVLLQAEFRLELHVYTDLVPNDWVRGRIACQQRCKLTVLLDETGEDTLDLLGTPALLHDQIESDARSCICHGVPIESGHAAHKYPPAKRARSEGDDLNAHTQRERCPVSGLWLGVQDVQELTSLGHFLLGRRSDVRCQIDVTKGLY